MNFNGNKLKEQLNFSTNAALMLNSACQAIVETYLEPSNSPWFNPVREELSEAQKLVRSWRQEGYLYFDNDILTETANCG
jgi:hypothetical protein